MVIYDSVTSLQKISELSLPLPLYVYMKTYYWFNRNRVLSHLRFGGVDMFITAPSHLRNSLNRAPCWPRFILIPLVLACFALALTAQGQLSPPPDGNYSNNNTAEGEDALFNLDISTGVNNTAVGFETLYSNNTGSENTANGAQALYSNYSGGGNTANGASALYKQQHRLQ